MVDVKAVLRSFDRPDEVRAMAKGRFEIVTLGGRTFGRASYEPGWKWSRDAAPLAGTPLCGVEHLGLVLAGTAAVAFENGDSQELTPGTLFYVPPVPHDSWVVGDEPYVSLHLLGADDYVRRG